MLRYHLFEFDYIDTILTKYRDIDEISRYRYLVSKYNVYFYVSINVNHSTQVSTFYLLALVWCIKAISVGLSEITIFNYKYAAYHLHHACRIVRYRQWALQSIDQFELTPVVTNFFVTGITVKPLILVTLNFGIWVNLIILVPLILAFLLPTTLKRYCIQIFAARYFRELARLAQFAK